MPITWLSSGTAVAKDVVILLTFKYLLLDHLKACVQLAEENNNGAMTFFNVPLDY